MRYSTKSDFKRRKQNQKDGLKEYAYLMILTAVLVIGLYFIYVYRIGEL